VDLIFGVTGGPTADHPTVDGDDVEDWLANGTPRQLFFASGSTKTSEFPGVLTWLNAMLRLPPAERTVGGRRVLGLTPGIIPDDLAEAALEEVAPGAPHVRRNFGTRFDFVLAGATDAEAPVTKTVFLLNNTMPINFMFYGTPVEILDYSLAQLLDVAAMLARRAATLPVPRVCATDFTRVATDGVWRARSLDRDYPVPRPAGQPVTTSGG
jgi:hypothetical protein